MRTSYNTTIIHITKSSFPSILYKNKCLFFIRTKMDDSIQIRPSLATSKCTEKFTLSINISQPLTTIICTDLRLENPSFLICCHTFFIKTIAHLELLSALHIFRAILTFVMYSETKVIAHQHSKPSHTENTLT
jgi:hypothetical protein